MRTLFGKKRSRKKIQLQRMPERLMRYVAEDAKRLENEYWKFVRVFTDNGKIHAEFEFSLRD
jgi:hypothetical protein